MTNWLTGLPGNDLFGGETSLAVVLAAAVSNKATLLLPISVRSPSHGPEISSQETTVHPRIFSDGFCFISRSARQIYISWYELGGGITQTEICCEITSTCTEGKLENKFFICSIVYFVTSGISCQAQVFICQLSRVLQLPWSWDLPQSSPPFALMSVYSWLHWLVIAAHLNNTTLKHA